MCSQYQIDLFPTAQGGMAMCLRYGSPGNYRVMVYDGGTAETGQEIVAHIRTQYGTDVVDDVVCSHPSAEHSLGLWPVLENLEVRNLWMHKPWAYSPLIARRFHHHESDHVNLAVRLGDKLTIAYALDEWAFERRIPVSEPFQGMRIGPFTVMSPHRDWYVYTLIPELESPPLPKRRLSAEVDYLLQRSGIRFVDPESPVLPELWEVESLQESGVANVEMESSVVLFGMICGEGVLLTGNAGVRALSNAASYAEYNNVLIPMHVKFAQIPNRGNRNHVSPSVLDRLIGPKLPAPAAKPRVTAFVTTPHDEPAHDSQAPHQPVVNALIRRGAQVARIQGRGAYSYGFAAAAGLAPFEALPFLPKFA